MNPENIELHIANTLKCIEDKSSWNSGFCESLQEQVLKGRTLTENQLKTFERIQKKYSPEQQDLETKWRDSFTEDHRIRYEIAIQYYKRTPYYKKQRADYQAAYEAGKKIIPSYEDYSKIVDNKYAARVLEAHFGKPKYAVGSLVVGRRGSYRYHADIVMLVLRTDMPVVSAAKGAKRYELLPVGSSKTILLEEREIKAFRKPSKTPSKGVKK